MSVFPLIGSGLAQKSLVFGNHFRATPIRDFATIRTPRIAQSPFDPGALFFRPLVPTVPRNIGICSWAGKTSQIENPPIPQVSNIMGTFYRVSLGVFHKGFHGGLIRASDRVFLPLNIFVPSVSLFRQLFMRFDVLNCVFNKFSIEEVLPSKINVGSLMNRHRALTLLPSFSAEGEQGYE